MLVFAFIGFTGTDFAVSAIDGYDHGFGESQRYGLFLTIGGALVGALIHFLQSRKAADPEDFGAYEKKPLSYFKICRWVAFALALSALLAYIAYDALRLIP